MKATIAAAILFFACQVMASSFNQIGTNQPEADLHSIIVKTKKSMSVQSLGFNNSVMTQQPLIKEMQIHLLNLNPLMNVQSVLAELQKHPQVVYAQLNHKVTQRNAQMEENEETVMTFNNPNDTQFENQWSMELDMNNSNYGIDALTAWENYGTGGKDSGDNDLVVAIVDTGMQRNHPDLEENIWVNELETAGNGQDDDNNGYVDDINGWNGYNNSGNLQSGRHGTHVGGIVGAKGNNDKGVVGVNWDVKLMDVPGSSGNTAVVLRAYNYILKQKQLWMESNGEMGANVVSTNSSFGIDRADCTSGNYPAWNDVYTEMGKAGILSAAATMNRSLNVDNVGDVPTGCDSPYLVTVTNTRRNGQRASAAYGKTTIDLAAPGTGILSTVTNDGYQSLSGTSMATPHVAGAIAFLHSVASPDFAELRKEDPGQAALELKRMMMESVTKMQALEDETVSGGILNMNTAAKAMTEYEI